MSYFSKIIGIFAKNDSDVWNRESFPYETLLASEGETFPQVLHGVQNQGARELSMHTHSVTPYSQSAQAPDRYPLSPAQQRLWSLDQSQPGSSASILFYGLDLQGPLRLRTLQQSLQEIARRHQALRTTFVCYDGIPSQRILSSVSLPLPLIDLSALTGSLQEATAMQLAIWQAQRPFDLEDGPLMRSSLLRMNQQHHWLLLTIHHIVFDDWSLGVFLRELSALYQAGVHGEPAPLPELAIQYADYVLWQHNQLASPRYQRHLAYWKQQLAGASTLIALPTDKPGPQAQNSRRATETFWLSQSICQRLDVLSQQEEVSLFMILLAAFEVVLYRYTGQNDFLLGSPTTNRPIAASKDLIGLFTNNLILRAKLTGHLSFQDLLKSVCETTRDAYIHQDQPFESLLETVPLERDSNAILPFQVLFTLQGASEPVPQFAGLTIVSLFGRQTPRCSLALTMEPVAYGLVGVFEYDADLFSAPTVVQMAGYLQTVVERIIADPTSRISDLMLLTQAERHFLLTLCNATERAYPQDRGIHQLFEEQVERTPDAVALIYQDEQISYQALNRYANQLARHLRKLNVGPEKLVGICLERSLEVLVGLLGILKAGGGYVPLDPTYPEERLAFMLQHAQIAVLLTQQPLYRKLPASRARVVCLDTDWGTITQQRQENLNGKVIPEGLAYVIYTSGSTGEPKGVQVLHRSVVNFLLSMRQRLELTGQDIFFAITTLSFDIAALELFLPIITGARVVVASHEQSSDGKRMLEALARFSATIMQATPASWRLLLAAEWPEGKRLKLLSGGEALPRELANHLLKRGTCIWNLYGPTETTIWSAAYQVEPSEASVPIGYPIANTQIYLLDQALQPVPVGIAGEVYIGGHGVARGYLTRADLTADRFRPDPFSNQPGSRLYRTGDLARRRSDGNLVFLGRIDQQVKLRGHRIELGEIEAALNQQPSIRESVVVAREDFSENKRLVAYVVPEVVYLNQEKPVLEAEWSNDLLQARFARKLVSDLRSYLQGKLPDFMMPSAFVLLKALPLTPNGKVDRRNLPPPNTARTQLTAPFMAPRTSLEEQVARIWAEVLGTEEIGIHDNFFELGGDSLLAAQIIARIRTRMHIEVPMRALFECPTVASLIQNRETAPHDAERELQRPLLTREITQEEESLLSFAQQRHWFLDQLQPGSPSYNVPIGISLRGPLQLWVLQRSLQEIMRRHQALRTTFISRAGIPSQRIQPSLSFTLPLIDLRALSATERETTALHVATQEARQPFDLERGPLLRSMLLRMGQQHHWLLLTIHHIAFDDWSLGVFFQELSALYQAGVHGEPAPLPELAIQYADYALWQHNQLASSRYQRQLTYWKQQLAGTSPFLELPTDYPRSAAITDEGATRFFTLSKSLREALRELGLREGATLFMVLLAAFTILLHRYTGQNSIVVGTPIANRNGIEIEKLIGCFLNTLALRSDLETDATFQQFLKREKEVALDAYTHQEVPFEKVVEEVRPGRDPSYNPLFQVMFVLQDSLLPAIQLPEIIPSSLQIDNRTAKFDITLNMENTDQGLIGRFEYKTHLFSQQTIDSMVMHFKNLLEGILAHPEQRISELPLVTLSERHLLLEEWNDTRVEHVQIQNLSDMFQMRVVDTPDAIAVVFEHEQLTYQQVNERANRLAHYLQALRIGPDVRVGICVERSLDMVIGLLGILKAGGAYVALDPGYPAERLQFMLHDAQVPILLTQQRLLQKLPHRGTRVVCLDTDWGIISHQSRENPQSKAAPDNLAYVIYTSGSTGKPKGVALSHRALCNRIAFMVHSLGVSRGRTLQFASISFDVSFHEMFSTWCSGGTLVLLSEELRRDVVGLWRLLRDDAVEGIFVPVVMLQQLGQTVDDQKLAYSKLREINAAGEQLRITPQIANLFRKLKGCTLFNDYGPSETHGVTIFQLRGRPDDWPTLPPIGRPIDNVQIYLLDRSMHPVPIGVPGEVHIGGVCLGRGYHNQPDLTAERFIPNPFSNTAGARLYRTGDRARYRPDGNIDFLGRIDQQVKLRGYRIEVGEIEATLVKHPLVREAVALIREDIPGDKRLIAYVVGEKGQQMTSSELRQHLQRYLPDYMIPSLFVRIETLPLTPNRKIDRNALPAPDTERPELQEQFVAPGNPVEVVLAKIWADVLKIERVGILDNFFEVGGHSLLATQVISRIYDIFVVEITVRTFFNAPTIKDLAEELVSHEPEPGQILTIAQLHQQIENMSFDEIQRVLMEKEKKGAEY